jgi:hypothetical protein
MCRQLGIFQPLPASAIVPFAFFRSGANPSPPGFVIHDVPLACCVVIFEDLRDAFVLRQPVRQSGLYSSLLVARQAHSAVYASRLCGEAGLDRPNMFKFLSGVDSIDSVLLLDLL